MLPEGIQGMSGTLNRTGLYACRNKTHERFRGPSHSASGICLAQRDVHDAAAVCRCTRRWANGTGEMEVAEAAPNPTPCCSIHSRSRRRTAPLLIVYHFSISIAYLRNKHDGDSAEEPKEARHQEPHPAGGQLVVDSQPCIEK